MRERGFLYMGEGVTRSGTDILATRAIIDTVKVYSHKLIIKIGRQSNLLVFVSGGHKTTPIDKHTV